VLGVEQTSFLGDAMSAYSHKQTLAAAQEQSHFGTLRCQWLEPSTATLEEFHATITVDHSLVAPVLKAA